MQNSSWLLGPRHLLQDETHSAETYPLVDADTDKELRSNVTSMTTHTAEQHTLWSTRFGKFSSWKVMIRAIANLKHVAQTYSSQTKCKGWHFCQNSKTTELNQAAKLLIIKETQREAYNKELDSLQEQKPLPKTSCLRTFNPAIDDTGILRVGGRISRSNLPAEVKMPIIVPGRHHVATLLVRHYHESVKHQGRHFTEGAIRAAGFWIVGGKRLISTVLHNCVKCQKLRGRQEYQKMADLPSNRLTPAPPFTYVGLDTFGPWKIVSRRTRGGLAHEKRWAIIFTCLTTRAVHIEVIEDMGTSGFVNAMRRFVAIRGKVKEFCSDQGTNFVGTVNILKADNVNVEHGPVKEFLLDNDIVWRFNPPHSSHMGGVWERMIGVTRRILDSMLSDMPNKNLTHEVLCTFMAEVSSIINSRPIVPVSSDPENPTILTPSTVLTQKMDHIVTPLVDIDIKDLYKAQWKYVQALADIFWNRWRTEYLHTLQGRRKWQDSRPNLNKDDVVLLRERDLHRNDWPIGVVKDTLPAEDGHVRKVIVRIVKDGKPKEYLRPITELVLLFHPK